MHPKPISRASVLLALGLALLSLVVAVAGVTRDKRSAAAPFVDRVNDLAQAYVDAVRRGERDALRRVLPPQAGADEHARAFDAGRSILEQHPEIATVRPFGAEIKGLVWNDTEPVFSFDSTLFIDAETGSAWVNSLELAAPSRAVFVDDRRPPFRDQPEVKALKEVYLPLLRQATTAEGVRWQEHVPSDAVLREVAARLKTPESQFQELRGPSDTQARRTIESAVPYLGSQVTDLNFGFDDLIVLGFDDKNCLGGLRMEFRAFDGQVYLTEIRRFLPLPGSR